MTPGMAAFIAIEPVVHRAVVAVVVDRSDIDGPDDRLSAAAAGRPPERQQSQHERQQQPLGASLASS